MKKPLTGIVDLPIRSKEEDRLEMRAFEQALAEFIEHTDTPMTVAIQGEWGSGKTSLMNRLSERLCDPESSPFYRVWLNTWHFALVNDESEILTEIIQALIDEVVKITREEHPEKLKRFVRDVYDVSRTVFKGVSRMALKTTVAQVSSDAADHVDDVLFSRDLESKANLVDLRRNLENLIHRLVERNKEEDIPKRTILFFIDDLDRIEPSVAVRVLELLKNIFDIENCVFVLAIDYDVIVNGLQPKFGVPDAENEREFRSFFDKIIQLPFRMPVQAFEIDEYLKDTLLSTGVISDTESQDRVFVQSLSEMARLSLGTNPRSLKRLANSLSFINLLFRANQGGATTPNDLSSAEKQISFGLVCLQIAFPSIYNLLAQNPDFPNWTEEFARAHQADRSVLKEEDAILRYQSTKEEWKRIIMVTGSKSAYLSKHTYNVVRLLEKLQDVARAEGASVADLVSGVLEFSSVTNVKADLRPKLDINHVRVLYQLNEKLLPLLKKKLRPPLTLAERTGRMVAKVTYRFQQKKGDHWVAVFVEAKSNNLVLRFGNQVCLFPVGDGSEDPIENLEKRGKAEYFNQLLAGFLDLEEKFPSFSLVQAPQKGLFIKKETQMCGIHFQTYVEAPEKLYTARFLDTLSDFIVDFMLQSHAMIEGDWGRPTIRSPAEVKD